MGIVLDMDVQKRIELGWSFGVAFIFAEQDTVYSICMFCIAFEKGRNG